MCLILDENFLQNQSRLLNFFLTIFTIFQRVFPVDIENALPQLYLFCVLDFHKQI